MTISIDSIVDGVVTLSSFNSEEIQLLDPEDDLYGLSAENVRILPNGLIQLSSEYFGLIWDKVGDRVFETGLDRGVLYLPNGSGVPWNGLTSVIESFNKERSSVYYEGRKINDLITLGDFSATMKAVTYPDEFLELEGLESIRKGFYAGDQKPKTFGLCYRTLVGNDLDGEASSYKIHILYNVTAIPSDKTYATLSSDPSIVEFEWNISAVPEEIPGLNPTAHYILHSEDLDPWLLRDIEDLLYGSSTAEASLLPMADLVKYIDEWFRIKIIDNGDGTWQAVSLIDGFISFTDVGETRFQIVQANALYLDEVTYQISDTTDISDVPQIRIDDNGDGTWTATTEHDNLIIVDDDGSFEIRNANSVNLGSGRYRLSDTTDTD